MVFSEEFGRSDHRTQGLGGRNREMMGNPKLGEQHPINGTAIQLVPSGVNAVDFRR